MVTTENTCQADAELDRSYLFYNYMKARHLQSGKDGLEKASASNDMFKNSLGDVADYFNVHTVGINAKVTVSGKELELMKIDQRCSTLYYLDNKKGRRYLQQSVCFFNEKFIPIQ